MVLNCPKCGQHLRWSDLKSKFACPGCSYPLRSNVDRVTGWSVALLSWPPFVFASVVPAWVTGVSVLALGGLFLAVVNRVVTVERGNEQDAT